jgi:hypothetical protein
VLDAHERSTERARFRPTLVQKPSNDARLLGDLGTE